jgi:hypothetical protein
MRKRVRASAVGVLAAAATALIGGVLAASTAFAYPAPPTNIDIDSNGNLADNVVNSFEITSVKVTGNIAVTVPPVDDVRVQVVNSATCAANALPQSPEVSATITSPTTWEYTFDLSNMPEGAVLCARARASNDGVPGSGTPGKVYSPKANSTDFPVVDTVVNAGTVVIVDPLDDGYLNADETLNGTVSANYTAADADATRVDTWWGPDGANTAYGHVDCGTPPAVFGDYSPPSSGNSPLTSNCAGVIPEGDTLSLMARWADDAGNFSAIASADLPLSRPLVKDTVAPDKPKVKILPPTLNGYITAANANAVLVHVKAELDSKIKLDLTDGGTTLSQQKMSTDPNPISFTFNAGSLLNCNDSDIDPNTNATAPASVTPQCIEANATATDRAGNTSPAVTGAADTDVADDEDADGTDQAFKDARIPEVPILSVIPGFINTDINTIVELEVTGIEDCSLPCDRDYARVNVTLSDQDPGTPDLLDEFNTYFGDPAIFVDTAPLTDGIITVRATLTDGVGNVSAVGTTTATKGLTTPSVVVTSPAQNSLNTENVRIAGTATPGSQVTVYNAGNNEPIVTNIPVDSTGAWQANYRFLTSGTKTIYARKIGDNVGSNVRSFDVDAIKPSGRILTINGSVFTPGLPISVDGTATDDFSGVAAVRIDVYDARNTQADINIANPQASQVRYGLPVVADKAANCAACATFQRNVLWSYDLTGQLARGVYVVQATPVDRAGNRSAQPEQITIVVL